MAYRQLFSITFALGFGLAACGGDGAQGSPAETNTSDQAPANADKPPGNSDRPPGNPDQPPGNPDQPPGNPDQPPGGGAKPPGGANFCDAFCDQYGNDCPGNNTVNENVRRLCGRGCDQLLGGKCADGLATLLTCVVGLPAVCTEAGPSDAEAARCTQAFEAWSSCDDDKGGKPPAQAGCTQADACVCADACQTCRCAAGAQSASCDAICE